MATALPRDSLDLPGGTPEYVHHFEPYPGADRLIVCIAGLHTDTTKPRTIWPYRLRLARIAAHRLFVDPEPPERGRRWFDTPLFGEFVEAACRSVGVPPERTILCGSSLGGTLAIDTAVRIRIGHVMAGSPVAFVGDYVMAGDAPERVRLGLGGRTPSAEKIERLNAFVLDALAGRSTPLRFDLYFGEADELFPRDFDALVDACAKNPTIRLHTKTEPGYTHHNVYRPWSRYMTGVLKSLVGVVPSDVPEWVATHVGATDAVAHFGSRTDSLDGLLAREDGDVLTMGTGGEVPDTRATHRPGGLADFCALLRSDARWGAVILEHPPLEDLAALREVADAAPLGARLIVITRLVVEPYGSPPSLGALRGLLATREVDAFAQVGDELLVSGARPVVPQGLSAITGLIEALGSAHQAAIERLQRDARVLRQERKRLVERRETGERAQRGPSSHSRIDV